MKNAAGPGKDGINGLTFALAGSLSYAIQSICLKLAFNAGVDALVLVALRNATAGLALGILASRLGVGTPIQRKSSYKLLFLGATGVALASGSLLAALERLPAGTAILAFYSYPAITALLAAVLGREALTWRKGVILAVGFTGVGLVASSVELTLNAAGLLLALVAAASTAVYAICLQSIGHRVHPIKVTYLVLGGAGLTLLPLTTAARHLPEHFSLQSWAWICATGIILISAVAFHAAAVSRIGPTRTAIAGGSEPVLTVLLAAVFLNEALSARQLVGGMMVVISVIALPLLPPVRAKISP